MCSNDVLCLEYKATRKTIIRYQENESLEYIFLCETVRLIMIQIIKNLILRINSDLIKFIYLSRITKHIIYQLSSFFYFNFNSQLDSNINLT